jgi:flagellar L-ring protein FlgH
MKTATVLPGILVLSLLPALGLRAQATDDHAGQRASLWRSNSMVNSLYTDPKARGMNDIVIIKVSESSTASNKAGLTTSKKSTTSMGINAFLGLETDLKGKLTDSFDPTNLFGSTTNNSNAGSGEATRSSTLSTYIAARVVDLMPNGNLVIEARKEVMVNREKQVVVLRGIARPRDISYEDIIESSKIADMQINFSGKGPVTEQTRRGWLSWFLNMIWPF